MRELSVFVDESGNPGEDAKYYLLALVLHDQSDDVFEHIGRYESILSQRGLRDIPLHMNPLMRANDDYRGIMAQERNRLLTCFSTFAWMCPFSYEVLAYRKSHFQSDGELFSKMRKDLILLLFDKLEYLQGYDVVKIYYDDGQGMVTDTLHAAFEYALGKQAIVYRDCDPVHFRLQQIADFICEIELAAIKYEANEVGRTERIFFGTHRDFKKNYLKKLRKKRLA
jgi:hypothetical protein